MTQIAHVTINFDNNGQEDEVDMDIEIKAVTVLWKAIVHEYPTATSAVIVVSKPKEE